MELIPAVAAAIDLPGLPMSKESHPTQPLAGDKDQQDPSAEQLPHAEGRCAMLRRLLGRPQPWPMEQAHLSCVGVLLRAGAALSSQQWQRVQRACATLPDGKVRVAGHGRLHTELCRKLCVAGMKT